MWENNIKVNRKQVRYESISCIYVVRGGSGGVVDFQLSSSVVEEFAD
jgi:hypothetical protein